MVDNLSDLNYNTTKCKQNILRKTIEGYLNLFYFITAEKIISKLTCNSAKCNVWVIGYHM